MGIAGSPKQGSNSRRYPRYSFRGRATVVSSTDGELITADLQDISRAGLALHTNRHYNLGTEVVVEVHLMDPLGTPAAERLVGRVSWIDQWGEGVFGVSIAFERPLSARSHPLLNAFLVRMESPAPKRK